MDVPDKRELLEIEEVAVGLANLAGAEIAKALGGIMSVKYKGGREEPTWRDPVSEVDHRIEELFRARLGKEFPDHGIIGEEFEDKPGHPDGYVWAVDPIDGTANFVNGFPLCAAAVGVLHHGVPVVGAVWCGTSHALRPGVYHARAGGTLRFDNDEVVPRTNPAVRRRLAGVPRPIPKMGGWETRKTGSAAIECAFVAAGILEAARFEYPNIWDVAGGIALVEASGALVLAEKNDTWQPFEGFEPPMIDGGPGTLRAWKGSIAIGRVDSDALISGFELVATAD